MTAHFIIAVNPKPKSRLPYILSLPVAGERPVWLATGDVWPTGKDLYCHPLSEWPEEAEVVERLPVQACWRQGAAVHLVLQRRQRRRSLFVWTKSRRGRPLIFWRSPRSMRGARPGIRVPQARALEGPLTVAVDTRERYPWRFTGHAARIVRRHLPIGDYGIFRENRLVAAVERKSVEDLATSAVSGTLVFVLQELSTLPYAAVILEGRLSDLIKREEVRPGWLLNIIATLQVQFPRVNWMFAETRKIAEDYAYRWLAAVAKSAQGRREPPEAADAEGPPESLPVLDPYLRRATAAAEAREGKIWTSRDYAARFRVSRSTAISDLKVLVERGVLEERGARRNRRYVAASQEGASAPAESGGA